MVFKIFSSRAPQVTPASRLAIFDGGQVDAERAAMTGVLHALLETLPQAYSGRENITHLLQTILTATTHLRFAWVGMCEGYSAGVEPFSAVGACVQESDHWRLHSACLNVDGAYSEAFPESSVSRHAFDSLFAPWQDNLDNCTVKSALAIPLRMDRQGMCGMIVFYAETVDYFAHMGVAPFLAFAHVAEIIFRQSNLLHTLSQKAHLCAITGLMNRRQTMFVMQKAVAHAEKVNEPMSILICRIEEFGKINDTHGWMVADTILATFAKEAAALMRPHDKGGRWTGVEFLYVLPGANAHRAETLAHALQDHFLAHPVSAKNVAIRLALVVGVATHSQHTPSIDHLIKQANLSMLNPIQPAEREISYPLPKG